MKKFDYKAKTLDGKKVVGTVEAADKKEAVKVLKEKELVIFFIREKGKSGLKTFFSSLQKASLKEVTDFTRQLSTMVSSGLSLTDSLVILRDQAKPVMRKVLNDVVKEVEGGSSLHDALAKHPKVFSEIFLAIIKSGEASGSIDKVLIRLAESLEKQLEFRSKVKGAMMYPVIIVIGMIIVIFIMMIYVIPGLTSMYEEFNADLPITTKILIASSNFMRQFWYLIIISVMGSIYGFGKWRETSQGQKIIDSFLLKLPILGELSTKLSLTEISRTLSMLLSAGVTIISALDIVAGGATNVIYKISIKKISKAVEKGISLASAFEQFAEYPPLFIQMIAIGEETGKVDEALLRLSKQFEMEAESTVKSLTTAIEPLMMVVLGVGVGFIIISIITPIYSLTSQF